MAKVSVNAPIIDEVQEFVVSSVFVSEGEVVEDDAVLLTLESDKAVIEVCAPRGGAVKQIIAKEGESLAAGSLVAILETPEVESSRPSGSDRSDNLESLVEKSNASFKADYSFQLSGFYLEQILRVINEHIADEEWSTEAAKNNLDVLINMANTEQFQVINTGDNGNRFLVMPISKLATIIMEGSRQHTWGEAFNPTSKLPGIKDSLEIGEE